MPTRTLTDFRNRPLRLTEERWAHVLSHPEHDEHTLQRIVETARTPDHVVRSRTDPEVELFYRQYERTPVTSKYLCLVAKTGTGSPFIITAYLTDAIKKGEELWNRPDAP
jgi:hypothetical protein